MKKIFILLYFIISISFSQVVPTESLDGINIDEIPQNIPSISSDELNIDRTEYVLITAHRPSNVDHENNLSRIVEAVEIICKDIKVV